MNERWIALAREASSAAEHLASGATLLGRANYAQDAYYTQAFFALSIGFERCGKLAILIDGALDHAGKFPPRRALLRYGHDLTKLLAATDAIAEKRGFQERCPRSAIHDGIVETLSEFAMNVTRYYNLELVAGPPATPVATDPIAAWSRRVTEPILAAHYKQRFRERDERDARAVDMLIGDVSIVRYHTETGAPLRSVYESARETSATDFAKRWERMYVLQLARFVGSVISELGFIAQSQQLPDVPYVAEFFAIFRNSDAYLRERRTWSIYR